MAVKRVQLKGENWVDLTDRQKVRHRAFVYEYSKARVSSDGQQFQANAVEHQVATATVRIANWSIQGGKEWPIAGTLADKAAVIEDLDGDVFDEIAAAVSAFEAELGKKSEDAPEKNATSDGAPS